jgi:endonuclease/exonuclease/phosphatase (EEP) superfamily protein YafD
MSFKVLQFNMQFGQSWREADPDHAPVNLDQTIAEIVSHNADLIMLQEVERATPGWTQPMLPSNYVRLRQALAGYDSFSEFPKTDERELPFGIGLAIFSKAPLREPVKVDVPSPPVEFIFRGKKTTPTDRVLIAATTTMDGRDLRVMNTHLLAFFMLNSSSADHPGQRRQVVELMRQQQGPALLTGDFNVSRYDSLVQQFAAAGCQTVQFAKATWRRRPFVLDHIFYNNHLRCVGHEVKPTPASDHHVLVAEFEFGN